MQAGCQPGYKEQRTEQAARMRFFTSEAKVQLKCVDYCYSVTNAEEWHWAILAINDSSLNTSNFSKSFMETGSM